jgi:hypothetical protein
MIDGFKDEFSIMFSRKKTWKIVLENVKYFLSSKHSKLGQFVKITSKEKTSILFIENHLYNL